MFTTGDRDSRNIINIIQAERVAGGGLPFSINEKMYVHTIVLGMKSIGTWNLSNAIYGFVGGTAASHKWNWKDMRDLDVAFRLVFFGTIIHSVNGIQGDGVTGYVDTKINLSTVIPSRLIATGYYTNTSGNTNRIDMGAGSGTQVVQFNISFNGIALGDVLTFSARGSNNGTKGIIIGSYASLNTGFLVLNGNIITRTTSAPAILPLGNPNFYILARNNSSDGTNYTPDLFSSRSIQYMFFGLGLTDLQAIQQSHIVTSAQAILNRQ